MKLIKHIIFADVDNDKKIMINSLNGIMDSVGIEVFETIAKWQQYENVVPQNDFETSLYRELNARGYLLNSHEEEMAKKNEIIVSLRANHSKLKEIRKHLTFAITYNCNFRCNYCFEGEQHIKKEVFTPEQIDSALKFAGSDLESIGLFGGEPLLLSNMSTLKHLFSKANDKTYNITTNGYYLLEFFDILSKLNISNIMVTLDGEEKTHNSRRCLVNGKATYQKIISGIQKYLENGVPICIRINIDKYNLEESKILREELISKFYEHKDSLTFEMQALFGLSRDEKTEIRNELLHSDIEYSFEKRRQRNRMLGRFSPIINALTVKESLKPVYSFCQAHQSTFLLDPYGDIYPCMPAVGNKELAIGSYYPEVRFKENSIYNRNIENIPECKECIYSLLCGGGCPLALSSYKDVFKPVCYNIRDQVHNVLPQYYRMDERKKRKEC